MPLSDNFDSLFAAVYQQERLPELLPGDKAQEMIDRLDAALEKLDAVVVGEVVPAPASEEDLQERFIRMHRFYIALGDFAESGFLDELHSESERYVVNRLRNDLRAIRASVAHEAQDKAQQISESARSAARVIMEALEEQRLLGEARRLEEGDEEEEYVEVGDAFRYDVAADLEDDDFDDFDDDDDYEDDEDDDDPYAESTSPFEALFGINYEQDSLIKRLPEDRIEEFIELVDQSLAKLNAAKEQVEGQPDPWDIAWDVARKRVDGSAEETADDGDDEGYTYVADYTRSPEEEAAGRERVRQLNKMMLVYKVLKAFPESEDLKALRTDSDVIARDVLRQTLTEFRTALTSRRSSSDSATSEAS